MDNNQPRATLTNQTIADDCASKDITARLATSALFKSRTPYDGDADLARRNRREELKKGYVSTYLVLVPAPLVLRHPV